MRLFVNVCKVCKRRGFKGTHREEALVLSEDGADACHRIVQAVRFEGDRREDDFLCFPAAGYGDEGVAFSTWVGSI
jgi:hypothetical protein